jgi:hypothetical protein
MHALDRTSDDVATSCVEGGAPIVTDDRRVRCAVAAGLRLVAQGILVIADAFGATDIAPSRAKRSPRRVAVRLPREPLDTTPVTDDELAAAARVARRAGILR